jgi:hypothetical protein
MTGQLEGNHGVASLLKQTRELTDGVLASSRAANACGDLFPVSHGRESGTAL